MTQPRRMKMHTHIMSSAWNDVPFAPSASGRATDPSMTMWTHRTVCFYHHRFGSSARQCRPPCTWKQGNGSMTPAVGHACLLLEIKDRFPATRFLSTPWRKFLSILCAANSSPIRTCQRLPLGTHSLCALLLCADIDCSILGADFLRHHKILVDVACRRVLLLGLTASIPCSPSMFQPLSFTLVTSSFNPFLSLLREFPLIILPIFSASNPKHGVVHRIQTCGQPVWSHPHRLSAEKLCIAKNEFLHLQQVLSDPYTAHGRPHYIWRPRPMENGSPVVTTGA